VAECEKIASAHPHRPPRATGLATDLIRPESLSSPSPADAAGQSPRGAGGGGIPLPGGGGFPARGRDGWRRCCSESISAGGDGWPWRWLPVGGEMAGLA
jgi:hypothetical protein